MSVKKFVLPAILIIGIFFRFYNYFNRIHFVADSTLFAGLGYYAFSTGKLPLVGTFAQGPFFTGPYWIWILSGTYLAGLGRFSPWFFTSFLSLVFIGLVYIAGSKIGGKRVGFLAAFFAAISPMQIETSFDVWNATADPFLGLLAILFTLKLVETKRPIFAFLTAFTISLATAIHFQSMFLAPLLLVGLISVKFSPKSILAMILGGAIPLLPFLYFDLRFYWFETRRIWDYLTVISPRMYIPNRWLTYAGVFWPTNWANILGGNIYISSLLMVLTAVVSLLKIKSFPKNKNYFLIAIVFALSFIMMRYYGGERQTYYTNYAHAFVILLTAWTIFQVYNFRKILGVLILLVITFFTLKTSVTNLTKPLLVTYGQIRGIVSQVYDSYPMGKFAIYECPNSPSFIATSVGYEVYYDKRASDYGTKIGVCFANDKLSWREVSEAEIDKPYMYQNKSTSKVYSSVAEWWIKNPPGKALY